MILDELKIQVRAKPNSKKESVEKMHDGTFLVRVNTPPVEGKANTRVIELLAEYFSVAKSSVKLWRGEKSKIKVFLIQK